MHRPSIWPVIRLFMLAAAAVASPAAAQPKPPPQKVVPPPTHYWLSAATQSGFGMALGAQPDMRAMMRMATGGGGAVRMLQLDLGSRLPSKGAPTATQAIPPGMAMGPSLLLKAPAKASPPEPGEESLPTFEKPKGRLLLFWGCGETARPGQPVVFDFAKMAAGQVPAGLFTQDTVRIANPPSAGRYPTYGGWPNDDSASRKGIPASASVVGSHKVTGPSTPEIAFALQQDWMAPVTLRQSALPSGALRLDWNGVPGATGHFAQMMGGSEKNERTIVFWSSSEVQTFLSGLADYIAPAEAVRLVAKKQMLAPATASCTIPKEAMAAAEGALLTLVSHGPEVNIIHPPRPEDPKIPWVQEWAVKARFVSRTGGIAGMEMPMGAAGASAGATASGKPKCPPSASEEVAGGIGGALGGSLGRGIGRAMGKKKPPEDCEP